MVALIGDSHASLPSLILIKKVPDLIGDLKENGVSEEVRTLDIYLGKVVLYQLSYTHFI